MSRRFRPAFERLETREVFSTTPLSGLQPPELQSLAVSGEVAVDPASVASISNGFRFLVVSGSSGTFSLPARNLAALEEVLGQQIDFHLGTQNHPDDLVQYNPIQESVKDDPGGWEFGDHPQ